MLRRRELLQVGFSAFAGIGFQALLPKRGRGESAHRAKGRATSLILVYLTGGASHHDTFDMKPAASAEIRGPFAPIQTTIPGLQICEHLPRLASAPIVSRLCARCRTKKPATPRRRIAS